MQTQDISMHYETAMYDDRADYVHFDSVLQQLFALEYYGSDFAG